MMHIRATPWGICGDVCQVVRGVAPDDSGEMGKLVFCIRGGNCSGRPVQKWPSFGIYFLQLSDFIGAPGEIRTPDTLIRSQVLYPTELRARIRPPVYIRLQVRFQGFYTCTEYLLKWMVYWEDVGKQHTSRG